MEELYWITRLCKLSAILNTITIATLMLSLITIVLILININSSNNFFNSKEEIRDNKERFDLYKKWAKNTYYSMYIIYFYTTIYT